MDINQMTDAEIEKAKNYVHYDWMEGDRTGRAVVTDARSSPIVQMINGVEHRVMDDMNGMKIPPVPVDPRLRRAHIEWEASPEAQELRANLLRIETHGRI